MSILDAKLSGRKVRPGILLALAVVMGACETTVELDFPTHDPLLMMNSIFWPDARFELFLGEAVDVPTGIDNATCIDDGTVELWQGNQLLEVLPHVGDCLYRSPSRKPEPGVAYTVKASAPGYLDIEATDTAPMPVPTEFEYEWVSDIQTTGHFDVTITISDPGDVKNWYRLLVYYRHEAEEGETWYNVPYFRTDNEAIIVDNQDFVDFDDDGSLFESAFFTDIRITPGRYEIDIEVLAPYSRSVATDLIVVLDGISEHFYDYSTTYRIQRQVGDNPFAEPVQVTTNVRNGFGLFGGFNREALDVEIE